jgi:hypothetical protein
MTELDPVTYGVPVRIVGTDHIVKTHITHDGGATQPLATFVAGTIITDIVVVITEAFNGTPTIDIGDTDADSLLPNAGITKTLAAVSGEDESTRGVYLYSTHRRCKYLAAGATFNAVLGSLGTTTTGEADVLITYQGP